MNKTLLIVIGVVGLLALWAMSTYNGLVSLDEQINEKWAQVQNVYQRRGDLIPNLVNTVKGVAKFEQDTLTAVVNARSQASSISPEAMKGILNDPAAFNRFQQAQEGLSQALSRLMVTVERYPELKASQGYMNLMTQLEGAENRVTIERKSFNEVVKPYNEKIRSFPGSLLANIFGFSKRPYFEASATNQNAPQVNF